MLTAVAKKTAGEFFAAVDDVLTGASRWPSTRRAPARSRRVARSSLPVPAGRTPNGFVSGAHRGWGNRYRRRAGRAVARTAALMRPVTVAAVQVAPSPEPLTSASIADNALRAVALVRRCHEATGAELIVLPESVTTGFTPGVDRRPAVGARERPARPAARPVHRGRRRVGRYTSSWARTDGVRRRAVVHNAAVVIGGSGTLLGTYHKTHPFGGERADRGGWVTPGDDVLVVETRRSAGSA